MKDAGTLQSEIMAVCPVLGVSIGNPANKDTWVIVFDPAATPEQKTAALAVVDNFDPYSTSAGKLEKDLAEQELNGIQPISIATRNCCKVIFAAINEVKTAINQLIAGQTPTPLVIRTWKQAMQLAKQKIRDEQKPDE